MVACTVKISGADGEGEHCSTGALRIDGNNFTIDYRLDGDNCRMKYSGGVLTQIRRGGLAVKTVFRENAETVCEYRDNENGLGCTFSVFTEKAEVVFGRKEIKSELIYRLNDERINLKFSIEF